MGNYTSCCSPAQSDSKTAKLLDPHGNLRRVEVPVTAAELMLEEPGHVVSSVDEIQRSRRILAMRADDELKAGKVYVLVSGVRVNCKVSELEMALIDSTCQRRRKTRGSSKVLPAVTEGSAENGEKDTGFSGHRSCKPRQWNPVLEPIYEGI